MKKQVLFLVLSILLFSRPAPAQETTSASPSLFLGNFCWNYVVDDTKVGSARLGITQLGKQHYLVTGTVNHGGSVRAIQGGAEIVSQKILMVLHSAHTDESATAVSQSSITLNGTNFRSDGEFASISQDYNYSTKSFEPTDHSSGSLTSVSCK